MEDNVQVEKLYCEYCENQNLFKFATTPDFHYNNSGEWDSYRCSQCKHISQYPIPTDSELEGYYPKSYYSFRSSKFDFRPSLTNMRGLFLRMHFLKRKKGYKHLKVKGNFFASFLYRILLAKPLLFDDPVFSSSGTFLDYGSGSGNTVATMEYLGWNAEGIDISVDAIENGKKSGLNLRCGSHEQLDEYEDYYNVIYSSHAIEHISDVDVLFQKLHSSLKNGGTLAFTIPNGYAASIDTFKDYYFYFGMPVHINLFTPQSIRIALERVGFSDIQISTNSVWKFQIASYFIRKNMKKGKKINLGEHSKAEHRIGYFLTFFNYIKSLSKLKGDNLFVTCRK